MPRVFDVLAGRLVQGALAGILMLGLAPAGVAQEAPEEDVKAPERELRPEFDPTRRHHLSGLVGLTDVEGEESGVTLGLDYEYRVNRRLGVGAVVERAFDVEATTLLAVADLHLVRGLALQTGPGVETLDEQLLVSEAMIRERETQFVYRIGALYEFELGEGGFTVSPQLHYDWVPGSSADSVVFALAFGRAF